MLKFSSLRTLNEEGQGSPAQNYVVQKDDDEEATTYNPRSKGEEDFVKQHQIKAPEKHPVAPEDQFKGGTKHAGKHKSHEGEPGERQVVKAKKTFAQLRGGTSSKRSADKTGGDKQVVKQGSSKVTEEVELDENVLVRTKMQKIAKSNKPVTHKFKNGRTMSVDPDQAKMLVKGLMKVKGPSLKAMSDDIMSSPANFMKALAFADGKR